jgi:hypothetical protein
MPYTSNTDARRYTAWAQEDVERIAAQLSQVRKLARMGERLTVLEAITARWDAWSRCPVCFPWRGEAGTEHTCNLSPAERNEAAQLDISKHGDRHGKLVNEIGAAHRAWMEVRG